MSSSPRTRAVSAAWVAMQALVDEDRDSGRVRDALGLGAGRGRVKTLLLLADDGELGLSEIADAQGIDRPQATVVVDQLEALGLVERGPHPDDRRRKLVRLTTAGRAKAVEATGLVTQPPPSFTTLSRAEAEQLDGLLSRVRDASA